MAEKFIHRHRSLKILKLRADTSVITDFFQIKMSQGIVLITEAGLGECGCCLSLFSCWRPWGLPHKKTWLVGSFSFTKCMGWNMLSCFSLNKIIKICEHTNRGSCWRSHEVHCASQRGVLFLRCQQNATVFYFCLQ